MAVDVCEPGAKRTWHAKRAGKGGEMEDLTPSPLAVLRLDRQETDGRRAKLLIHMNLAPRWA
jgi:hypothetical protein